jgi:L,D-peptidoglycan transpeptidase YkuD (ErfK/YbiS/YcfS/YnhG family)
MYGDITLTSTSSRAPWKGRRRHHSQLSDRAQFKLIPAILGKSGFPGMMRSTFSKSPTVSGEMDSVFRRFLVPEKALSFRPAHRSGAETPKHPLCNHDLNLVT